MKLEEVSSQPSEPNQTSSNSVVSDHTTVELTQPTEVEQLTQAEFEARFPDKVCTACLEDNLIRAGICDTFRVCNKCGEEYCIHGVSKLDPQYCIYCCHDFKIVDVLETQQRSIHSDSGELLAVRKFKVRHITLSGMHWLFFNRQISSLTDVELDHAIEYHQAIYHGMIYEREGRFVKKIQRNRGKFAGNESASLTGSVASPFVDTGNGVQFVTTQQKATKIIRRKREKSAEASATKTVKASKSTANVDELIRTLLKAGMTMEQIAAIGKK